MRRSLANEPIGARPASTVYRLRKLARRQPALVGGVAATFLSLCAGLATTTWKAVEAHERERVAAGETTKVKAILTYLQRMLASVDAEVADGRDTTLMAAMLEEATAQAESELGRAPEVLAALRETIGSTYLSIGKLEQAGGSWADAERNLREALNIRRALLSDGPRGTAAHALLSSQNNLAGFLWEDGRCEEAEELWKEALEGERRLHPLGHHDVAQTLSNLASVLCARREYEAAEAMVREARGIEIATYGEASSQAAFMSNNLAVVWVKCGRAAAAEEMIRSTLANLRNTLGERHHVVASTLQNLGQVLRITLAAFRLGLALVRTGAFDEAETLVRERCDALERSHGLADERAREAFQQLQLLYKQWGKQAEAEEVRSLLSL